MCGIAGVAGAGGARLELLAAMAAALRHRGPDDEGYLLQDGDGPFRTFRGDETVAELHELPHWRSDAGRADVGLCYRRLAILDLSAAGHQPMLSPDGDVALVFNGEIYNYVELGDELEALGWRLRPCGDTAVLLAAFCQWGAACVHRLRGMWAFAAYERRARRLTLSRDRFGIKPLYYTRTNDALAFASEIKGLLPLLPAEPRGSREDVARLLAWGSVDDGETTLFEDVRAVPAGSNLVVEDGASPRLERWYDVDAAAPVFDGDLADAVDEYRRRFDDAVRLHLRSDVQVGSCLSGGLDSNLIAAVALAQLPQRSLATFTAVYDDSALDERRYVELHAARTGRFDTHFVEPTAEELLSELDRLVYAQEQPLGSSSPFAQWSVMRLAGGQRLKVLLDGQGADEAIGGYSYFAGAYLLELLRRGRLRRAANEARLLRTRRSVRVGRELARAAYRRLPPAQRRYARRATRAGYRLLQPDGRELAGAPPEPSLRTFRDYSVDALRHSLPELLRYEDRSSMAFSIESRVPFLDHPLVELALSLPADFKVREGWTKLVQRRAADGRVPDEIVWRRDKLGFATPQRAWRNALAEPLLDFVRAAELPPFLDRARVEALVARDSDDPVALTELWQMVFLLKWIDVFHIRFPA